MTSDLTRRAMLAGGVGLAGAAGLGGAPANPTVRPKYYHVSQSTINYQAEFNAGKMDIYGFMDTCRALDLDGLDIHVSQLKSQTDRAYLKEVRRACLNRGMPIASICVSTEFGRSAEAIPKGFSSSLGRLRRPPELRTHANRCYRHPAVQAGPTHLFQVRPVSLALELAHMDIKAIEIQSPASVHKTINVHLACIKLRLIVNSRLAHVIILRSDGGVRGRADEPRSAGKTHTAGKHRTPGQLTRHRHPPSPELIPRLYTRSLRAL